MTLSSRENTIALPNISASTDVRNRLANTLKNSEPGSPANSINQILERIATTDEKQLGALGIGHIKKFLNLIKESDSPAEALVYIYSKDTEREQTEEAFLEWVNRVITNLSSKITPITPITEPVPVPLPNPSPSPVAESTAIPLPESQPATESTEAKPETDEDIHAAIDLMEESVLQLYSLVFEIGQIEDDDQKDIFFEINDSFANEILIIKPEKKDIPIFVTNTIIETALANQPTTSETINQDIEKCYKYLSEMLEIVKEKANMTKQERIETEKREKEEERHTEEAEKKAEIDRKAEEARILVERLRAGPKFPPAPPPTDLLQNQDINVEPVTDNNTTEPVQPTPENLEEVPTQAYVQAPDMADSPTEEVPKTEPTIAGTAPSVIVMPDNPQNTPDTPEDNIYGEGLDFIANALDCTIDDFAEHFNLGQEQVIALFEKMEAAGKIDFIKNDASKWEWKATYRFK